LVETKRLAIFDTINLKNKKKMKKVILSMVALATFGFASAQEQTAKGKWLIEANTGLGRGLGLTAITFQNDEGGSDYSFGAEGGYFVMDNLAVKLGLGIGGNSPKVGDGSTDIGYKVGAKYYVINMIPVELSYNGVSKGNAPSGAKQPSFIGLQAGYAIFLGSNVSIEPGLRYNYSLLSKDDTGGVSTNTLNFNVGFALHF
jgi:Outer membrane protein beta-barrel domain